MNEQLKLAIELQNIDTKIFTAKRMIDKIPQKIIEVEIPFKEALNSFNLFKQRLENLDKRKREKERQLDDIGEKIKKLKLRTSEIKTNKEYQALLSEIDSFEKERWSIEEQILTIMEEIEVVSKQANSEEIKINADKKKIDELKQKLLEEKLSAEKNLENIKEIRSKVAALIEDDIYKLYINLIDKYDGVAVVEAKDEICLGCNMNIPPQLFVELKKNNDIITCPQCGRILFFKNES
jgi:predicted  nucleic acid-binding Zn-ribbon protein